MDLRVLLQGIHSEDYEPEGLMVEHIIRDDHVTVKVLDETYNDVETLMEDTHINDCLRKLRRMMTAINSRPLFN